MEPGLSDAEHELLRTICAANEKITVFSDSDHPSIYRSRFLAFLDGRQGLIIDEPSAESGSGMPLAKNEAVRIFFEWQRQRFMIDTTVLGHVPFTLSGRPLHALQVAMPDSLRDGERREYFRVELPQREGIYVTFHLYPDDSARPLADPALPDRPQEFHAIMIDISGGGFSLHADCLPQMNRRDVVAARFRLRPDGEELQVRARPVGKKKLLPSGVPVQGFCYIREEKRQGFNQFLQRVLRYVIDRQREILFK